MLDLLILSILIGFALGLITGIIPGIHTNNFALILLALAPAIADLGFANIHIAAMILANSITHTFLNIIPSVYLGAPDADTALAVLPGHAMLLDGMGMVGALLHDIRRARSNGIDHAVVGAEIAQAFGLDTRIVRIIKRHIGAGIPKDEAERLGLPGEDYLPETTEEMIVAHADNLVDDAERISIDERIRRMRKRGFDSDAIDRMIRLHNAVMG